MWDIGRFEADLSEYLWHLAQQIQCLSVGLLQVNPETMQRYDGVVGDFASPTDNIFS